MALSGQASAIGQAMAGDGRQARLQALGAIGGKRWLHTSAQRQASAPRRSWCDYGLFHEMSRDEKSLPIIGRLGGNRQASFNRSGGKLVGMICTRCGREVKRVCRDCQAAQARTGMLLHQRRFLQTWLVGEIELRVREQLGALHLELFDDRWHAYCGAAMFTVTDRRRVREVPADLCAECLKIFNELVGKARSEVR